MRRVIGESSYETPTQKELTPFENLFYHTFPLHIRRYLIIHPSFNVGIHGSVLQQDTPSFLFVTSVRSYILDLRLLSSSHYRDLERITYHHIQDVSIPFLYCGDPLLEIEKIPRYGLYFSHDDVRCIHEALRTYFLTLHRDDDPCVKIDMYNSMKTVSFRYSDLEVDVRVFRDGTFHYRFQDQYYLGGRLGKK